MSVYFIQSATGHVKIGCAENPKKRLANLQTAWPHPLNLLRTEPGGSKEEADYHLQFAELRVGGEWFECRGSLANVLGVEARHVQEANPKPQSERCRNCNKRAIAVGRFCAVCTIWSALMPDRPAYGLSEIREKHEQFKTVARMIGFEIPAEMAL